MNITPPPTDKSPEEIRTEKIQELIDNALLRFGAGISLLREAYDLTWSGADEEVAAFFDHLGPEKAAEMLMANSALAAVLNPAIAQRNEALAAAGLPPLTPQVLPSVMGRALRFPDEEHEGFWIEQPEEGGPE